MSVWEHSTGCRVVQRTVLYCRSSTNSNCWTVHYCWVWSWEGRLLLELVKVIWCIYFQVWFWLVNPLQFCITIRDVWEIILSGSALEIFRYGVKLLWWKGSPPTQPLVMITPTQLWMTVAYTVCFCVCVFIIHQSGALAVCAWGKHFGYDIPV